jgi:parvulin-like peptidyl-prolyl isomerase
MLNRLGTVVLLGSLISCTAKSAGPAPKPPLSVAAAQTSSADCLARANAEYAVPTDAPASIEVSQILVRHRELLRPQGAERTRADACLLALSALEMLQGGAEWNDAVQQYSDSGKSNNGNLGTIRPDEVTPNFARAAFSLESDELSYVVETDRGFHIILRH